ncbi:MULTISPECIES: tRNA (N(6)-L-threonylcarbamoyladenosine(37)-C(2))-methylthiotransferase MtaB [unclassified Bradyrhizobium]|uniref:tRNA (N(6)-L-threonylcarbamoyladenosine(37)-C(2))- methylthiotransferase MtaB n=1 Tax=unclassified Bradyrhizobium TaxID=2631580 RepID=UPI00247A2721|nr:MULTISPECIES: tRNA (N(6)-L-threonylcarbamoyladenosine(37)-C(2))-methylthiotransferase MtaB [unclassified Bradyrhizobium]WGS20963.1 tRNA (N(6)-L-threonylcarbamoyladenosine(37)-C(2))-methylthiotransferase MtaB [Bradyrhizobium sp. ISRA463]WGS27869.1 tRNA (N(6)-L-threonylcarbamoyladenosine(37)-C(2))-methylthiotransferase MtaB [Bradyrhizobium sp. ISRA464]
MSVDVVTFGCRLNAYESEVIRREAEQAGLADTIVINSCAVTNEAVAQARQSIRKLKRERPAARIVVTGCAAQTQAEMFAGMAEVDRVVGNDEKMRGEAWRATRAAFDAPFGIERSEKVAVADIMAVTEMAPHLLDGFERGLPRVFVQVQNGCDHRCTFCIIPYGRGNSRSVPMGAVVDQVRALVARGHAEIVLTGVDLTSYGADLPATPKLGQLVRQILRHVPELKRLRISSIDSVEADRDLLDVIADDSRLMPHLHLSLQSGDDMILKRMKRRHSRKDAIDFCAQVRRLRPDIAFGADIIAGFPTETEEMFTRSLDLVEECELTFLHVFPYSRRPGTPAARMPQVDGGAIKERAKRLRAAGEAALLRRLAAEVGATRDVLIESNRQGRTEHFLPVAIDGDVPGLVRRLMMTGHDGARLVGSCGDDEDGCEAVRLGALMITGIESNEACDERRSRERHQNSLK